MERVIKQENFSHCKGEDFIHSLHYLMLEKEPRLFIDSRFLLVYAFASDVLKQNPVPLA